ncbi:MAG TPA: hypothetical protein PKK48_06025 [Phycisphaerae bacterium]|nr:hypothetical protein [Phycisphaerae bacterium]HPS52483.1 hypothetical protein [Phycisphaerae bacterium]
MASELKKELTERFVKGIHRSFTPCPLIGPKWLQEFPNSRPADYRFYGIRKLAKAIGQSPEKILKTVMKNTSFKGLNVDVKIIGGIYVDIFDLEQQNRRLEAAGMADHDSVGHEPRKQHRRRRHFFFRKRDDNCEEHQTMENQK